MTLFLEWHLKKKDAQKAEAVPTIFQLAE